MFNIVVNRDSSRKEGLMAFGGGPICFPPSPNLLSDRYIGREAPGLGEPGVGDLVEVLMILVS